MTSNNETVSHQNLCVGDNAKSMMSEGNSARLTDDRRYSKVYKWISSFKISIYN